MGPNRPCRIFTLPEMVLPSGFSRCPHGVLIGVAKFTSGPCSADCGKSRLACPPRSGTRRFVLSAVLCHLDQHAVPGPPSSDHMPIHLGSSFAVARSPGCRTTGCGFGSAGTSVLSCHACPGNAAHQRQHRGHPQRRLLDRECRLLHSVISTFVQNTESLSATSVHTHTTRASSAHSTNGDRPQARRAQVSTLGSPCLSQFTCAKSQVAFVIRSSASSSMLAA